MNTGEESAEMETNKVSIVTQNKYLTSEYNN